MTASDGIAARLQEMTTCGTCQLSFELFHQLTRGLDGAERAELFAALPDRLQDQAWQRLGEQLADWHDYVADPHGLPAAPLSGGES